MKADKQKGLPDSPSYSPSWFDRFMTWVRRLPGPNWLAYLVMVGLLAGVSVIIQMLENLSQPIVLQPIYLLTLFQIFYVLTLLDFINKRAEKALESYRPILQGDESQYISLKNRLTRLPARPTLRLTIIVLLFFTVLGIGAFTTPMLNEELVSASAYMFTKNPMGVYSFLMITTVWMVNVMFIYHTFRQLKAIDYAYTQCSDINLFRQDELYAFSNLSAATAIGLVLSSPIWVIVDRGLITLIINIVLAILAVIIFVSPLLGAHRMLKKQKDTLQKNSLEKKESLIMDLYSRIENKDLTDIENYERALSSLEKAHNEIEKISTWPWKTETIRQVIGALFLPVTIWMIQFYLNQLLTN
jgi:hypothetical protein